MSELQFPSKPSQIQGEVLNEVQERFRNKYFKTIGRDRREETATNDIPISVSASGVVRMNIVFAVIQYDLFLQRIGLPPTIHGF